MIGRVPGFKGSRGQVKIIRNRNLNRRTLEPSTPLVKEMNRKGFTLIEIIVLIIMAGIIIPVIIVPFATGIRESNKPEMVATAMYLAHQRMEYLMKYNYRNAALNPQDFPGWTSVTIGGAVYQWQAEIHYVDTNFNVIGNGIDSPNDRRYKRIRVQVSDPDGTIYDLYSVVTSFP